MTRRRWALVAWGAILAGIITFAAIDGGRDCQLPTSGFFHWLLKNPILARNSLEGRIHCLPARSIVDHTDELAPR